MILDAQLLLSDKQQAASTATTTASTNVIDFGEGAGRNFDPKRSVFVVATAASNATSGYTVTAKVQGSADNSNWVDVYAAPAAAGNAIPKGTVLIDGFKLDKFAYRYLRVAYVTALADAATCTTAPKFTAGVFADDFPADTLAY